MKWRCSLFALFAGAIGFAGGCCGHSQGNSVATAQKPAAPAAQTQATPATPPPPVMPTTHLVKVPPLIASQPPPQAMATPAHPALDTYLAFDKDQKEVSVPNGTAEANFSFNLTNISQADVLINGVQTSCGCTVAKLPSQPWKLSPNDHGEISATMNLAGVPAGGYKEKTLTVHSDKGDKVLIVKTTVLAAAPAMSEMDRTNNVKAALVDRQVVFKSDCARCHVTPAKDAAGHDKMGPDLYTAVCGICHNAEHQASFVPNLHKLPEPTNMEFWRNWIMHGKPGTLMPAFAKAEGGILSDEQINSLAQYLAATIPSHPVVTAPSPPSSLQVQ
jgi:cytochrome c553